MIRFRIARLLRTLADKVNQEGPMVVTIEAPLGVAVNVADEIRFLDRRL